MNVSKLKLTRDASNRLRVLAGRTGLTRIFCADSGSPSLSQKPGW